MKKLIILSIVLVSAVSVRAQDGFTALHYDVSFGLGNTSGYISKPSFRGMGFDYQKMVNANIGIGLSVAWHTFYEKRNYDSYSFDDGVTTLTGVQFRYLNTVPMHITTNFYSGEEGDEVRAFFGLGIGTFYAEKKTVMGQWAVTNDAWQFSLQPQLGVLCGLGSDANVFLAGKFTTPFESESLNSYPYFSMNVGLAWMIH